MRETLTIDLTEQQEAFCRHFVEHDDRAAAARAAYPKSKRPDERARRLLKNPKIRTGIAALRSGAEIQRPPAPDEVTFALPIAAPLAPAPQYLQPRGLRLEEAAFYLGLPPAAFKVAAGEGRLPAPKAIAGYEVWDRLDLDRAFAAL